MTEPVSQIAKDIESISSSTPDIGQVLQQAHQSLASIEQVAVVASKICEDIRETQVSFDAAWLEIQQHVPVMRSTVEGLTAKGQEVDALLAAVQKQAEHVQTVQRKAEELLGKIEKASVDGQAALENLMARAETASKAAEVAQTSAQEINEKAQVELKETSDAKTEAVAATNLLKGLGDKAQTVEKRIADYEARLAELEKQSKEQLKTIIDLLPGATSAGLASAFDERRKSFLSPTKKWQWLFVGSVVLLVILAGTGMYHLYEDGQVLGYDELLRLWLGRLPVAAALVWLAIHASRESALAKRLEEDYGYKAAVAASFQGFQKQMAEIEEQAGGDSPLARLCADTLATIGTPPGRIYERHSLMVTPTDELKDAAKTLAGKIPSGGDASKPE